LTNKKQIFLNDVMDQIRSKEVKAFVTNELNHHLKEARKSWIEKGLPEIEAEGKAVEQMGSPTKLGIQLNKLHQPKVDRWLVLLFSAALGLSFLPMYSLGYLEESHFIILKILIVIIGISAVAILMLIDYRKWENLGWFFYAIGTFLLVITRLFSNTVINGLHLIKLGPITVESLMALPFFFLAWASFFNNRKLKVWHFFLLFLFPIFLFLSLPSISTIYIYFVMVFVMLWWSKFSKKVKWLITTATFSLLLLSGIAAWQFVKPYQIVRLLAFLHPEKYADGAGFITLNIREIVVNASWFGNAKWGFIPEAHTNFVFISFIHYYGWLLAIVLVVILSLFAARMMVILPKVKDSYGRLLLIGGMSLYGVQLVSNISMALGLFPLTSMSLPFMSYGLMPTVLNAVIIGVVLSVYRRKDLVFVR
jgi:cell division protein FtsW (lipid II flippase)